MFVFIATTLLFLQFASGEQFFRRSFPVLARSDPVPQTPPNPGYVATPRKFFGSGLEKRQGTCPSNMVTCSNGCCASGTFCFGFDGCCPIGEICTGVGDECTKGAFRCSEDLGGGCCLNGQTCTADGKCILSGNEDTLTTSTTRRPTVTTTPTEDDDTITSTIPKTIVETPPVEDDDTITSTIPKPIVTTLPAEDDDTITSIIPTTLTATEDGPMFGGATATRSSTTATIATGAPLVSSLSGAERGRAMWGLGGAMAAVAGLAALL